MYKLIYKVIYKQLLIYKIGVRKLCHLKTKFMEPSMS